MKKLYSKLIIVSIIIIITLLINFRFTNHNDLKQEKEIIIKTIYIPSPEQAKDSIKQDSLDNSLLKKDILPGQNYTKYYRSKQIHKKGYIS